MTRKLHNRAPNSGSISINPSGSVRAQILLPGGKRITKSFSTKREADAWLREMRNQVDTGLSATNYNTRVSDHTRDWLTRKRSQLHAKTFADYSHYCADFIVPYLGEQKLRMLTLQTVNDFYIALAEDGRPPSVIRYIHRILRALLQDAVRLGRIPSNPALYADVPAEVDIAEKMQIFSAAEYQKFIRACPSALHGNLYRLAIKTGMRQSELLGLRWNYVDLVRGEIRVIVQLSRFVENERGFDFVKLKSETSYRTIRIDADTVELLKNHYEAQKTARALMGIRWQDFDLVFPSSIGTPLDHRNMMRDFDKMLARAGLLKIRFHDLRHNAASMMLARNVSVVEVARYLGHYSPTVTFKNYAHLIPSGDAIVSSAQPESVS